MKIKARVGDNITEVTVPDDFTEEQIAEALKSHPDLQNWQNPPKSWPRAAAERTAGFVNEMGKGVPVAGHFIPRSKYAEDLVNDYPNTAMGARIAGGILSTAPVMAATGGGAGAPLAMNMLRQGLTGGAINVADKLAEKGPDTEASDLVWAGGLGTMGGAAGPVLGKFITPSSPRAAAHITADENSIRDDVFRRLASARAAIPKEVSEALPGTPNYARRVRMEHQALGIAIEDAEKRLAAVPTVTPPSKAVLDTLGGGAMGVAAHYFGGIGDPFTNAAIGTLVGDKVGPAVRSFLSNSRYGGNRLMHNPVLRSLEEGALPSIVSSVPPHDPNDQQVPTNY